MNLPATLLAARRASAAYAANEDDAQAAIQALGDHFVGWLTNADWQVVVSRDAAGAAWVSIAGTRNRVDLQLDVDLTPVAVQGGGHVAQGAYAGAAAVWDWVCSLGIADTYNVTGHSLGGWRTYHAPLFVDCTSLWTFESPKAGDAAFWSAWALPAQTTAVVHAADVIPTWPWTGPWQHPSIPHCWLHDGTYTLVDPAKLPAGYSLADHAIAAVIAALASACPQT